MTIPSTLPATKGVTEARDIYECANQLEGFVGPDTPDHLAKFLLREGAEAAKLADEIVRLRALASLSLPAPGEGEAPTWREFDHETIDYVLRYGGRCRECADHHGLCPNGLPCDVDDAKTAIRWVLKALNYGIGNGFLPSPALSQPQPDEMQPDTYTAGDFNGAVRGKRP